MKKTMTALLTVVAMLLTVCPIYGAVQKVPANNAAAEAASKTNAAAEAASENNAAAEVTSENSAAPQADSEYFGTAEWNSTFTSGTTITDSFYYSDDWFLEDPAVQNDQLALVSMQLVAAATDNDENGTGATFLRKLGFTQVGFGGFEEADPEGCNYTWGTKTIGEGEDAFTLEVIVIQSSSAEQVAKQIGWRQNFLVNGDSLSPEHASYAGAADKAAEGLLNQEISGNVKYWITGHSRGGAIAGILAARLKEHADSVYAYTLEAPANVELAAVPENAADYDYIHNYICSDDVVTMIPPWEMTRYGVEHPLDTEETRAGVYASLVKLGSDAAEVAEDYDSNVTKAASIKLIEGLRAGIPNREDYSALRTDTFTDATGNEVQITYDYQDVFISLMQVIFGNVTEGIDPNAIADELPALLPTVNALYKAVKEDAGSFDAEGDNAGSIDAVGKDAGSFDAEGDNAGSIDAAQESSDRCFYEATEGLEAFLIRNLNQYAGNTRAL